jgi:hypothetical protein
MIKDIDKFIEVLEEKLNNDKKIIFDGRVS